jgi:hypothetical protein
VEVFFPCAGLGSQQRRPAHDLDLRSREGRLQFAPVTRIESAVVVQKDDDFTLRAQQGGVALPGRMFPFRHDNLARGGGRSFAQARQRGFIGAEAAHRHDDGVAGRVHVAGGPI